MQKGFTLIELLVVVAIIGVLTAIAIPMLQDAVVRANVSATATDAKAIHIAFKRFYMDQNEYPQSVAPPVFELDTFNPLRAEGYYDGRVVPRLVNGQADAYDSPDDQGNNQEFWLEMTLKSDPTIRFLVSDSDDSPLGGGTYFDGIFLFKNGVQTSIDGLY